MSRITERKTHEIDASGKVPGRIATQVATLLMGKNKASFEKHLDNGDVVLVNNVSKMKIDEKKASAKIYYRHSGYPGGVKSETFKERMEKDPAKALRKIVEDMLPKNKLRAKQIKRLKITN